ncbi:Uma2 family endonuclease [Streptomyces alboflavus]|uniref:Uma2 family endonuclease n=1 Tax=Streptomyces alboflavus TaxID=67267 RepID=UPI0036ABEA16
MSTRRMTLLDDAEFIMKRLPGCRVEIMGGIITVTMLPDAAHASVLSHVMGAFFSAGLHEDTADIVQRVGLWLPSGPDDYAIPDLSLVAPDAEDHLVKYNCYAPAAFRMALEVTSNNYQNDLRVKVACYAMAAIPVYVIVDREHQRVQVLTDPMDGEYASNRVYFPGQSAPLPDSIGVSVSLDVAALLKSGKPSTNPPSPTPAAPSAAPTPPPPGSGTPHTAGTGTAPAR